MPKLPGAAGACLAALWVALPGVAGTAVAETTTASEWLSEPRAGVVKLLLVHHERGRPDGGELLVDASRRLLIWQGIPGELGCRRSLEAPFDSVRAVRDEPEGLIRLEIKGQPRGTWVFVPLPHAAWLGQVSSPLTSGIEPTVRDNLVGPDGLPMPVGGAASFAGPQMRLERVPVEVEADVRLAVERIRETLGRRPVPSVELYEALNGRPAEVSIGEILADPAAFAGRAVRVRGVAEPLPRDRGLKLVEEGSALVALPQPEIEPIVRSLLRDWRGQEVEVAGVLRRRPAAGEEASPEVVFWEYLGPESVAEPSAETPTIAIGDLLARPEEFADRIVRVVGRFRGRNLEHDLPEGGPRSAWVIKSGRDAIWVTGRKPAGRGFALRPDLAQDTDKWLEVVGRPERWKETTVLRARAVALTAPVASIRLRGSRLRTAEKPEVVFTLPLLGEEAVAPDTVFLVQFSTYMDEATFESRVRLRYADVPEPEGELRSARWRYDEAKRTLVVHPGVPLRRGATVELLLLPGITDAWTVPLLPAPAPGSEGILRLLRWQVQG